MERTYAGITYEMVKQPAQRPAPYCCDGCEIPPGECPGLSPNECCEPENLASVWKRKTPATDGN